MRHVSAIGPPRALSASLSGLVATVLPVKKRGFGSAFFVCHEPSSPTRWTAPLGAAAQAALPIVVLVMIPAVIRVVAVMTMITANVNAKEGLGRR
jgi:hypothetical protein